jgi:hypothetical protein
MQPTATTLDQTPPTPTNLQQNNINNSGSSITNGTARGAKKAL